MMSKFGLVKSYNPATGMAEIEYVRPDACAKCNACGVLNKSGTITLKADCAVGNWVRIEFPDGKFLSASAVAYLVPLLLFLGGLAAGYFLSGKQDLWAIAGALAGLGISLVFLKKVDLRIGKKPEWLPRVAEVYTQKPEMEDIGCGGQE